MPLVWFLSFVMTPQNPVWEHANQNGKNYKMRSWYFLLQTFVVKKLKVCYVFLELYGHPGLDNFSADLSCLFRCRISAANEILQKSLVGITWWQRQTFNWTSSRGFYSRMQLERRSLRPRVSCSYKGLTDWLTDRLERLINWLTSWLINWLASWLTVFSINLRPKAGIQKEWDSTRIDESVSQAWTVIVSCLLSWCVRKDTSVPVWLFP